MLRPLVLVGVSLAIVVGGASQAAAQTCSGLPAIGQNSKGNIGANVGFSKHFTATTLEESGTVGVGAVFTYGSDRAFGTFGLGKTNYTVFQFTTTPVSFLLGGQFAVGHARPISICPIVRLAGEWAGNVNGAGIDFSTDEAGGGANVGFAVGSSGRREIIPTLGLSFERFRETLGQPNERVSVKSTVGLLSLGVGFIFDKRIAIHPAISYPVGLPEAHVKVSVIGVFAYGRR